MTWRRRVRRRDVGRFDAAPAPLVNARRPAVTAAAHHGKLPPGGSSRTAGPAAASHEPRPPAENTILLKQPPPGTAHHLTRPEWYAGSTKYTAKRQTAVSGDQSVMAVIPPLVWRIVSKL